MPDLIHAASAPIAVAKTAFPAIQTATGPINFSTRTLVFYPAEAGFAHLQGLWVQAILAKRQTALNQASGTAATAVQAYRRAVLHALSGFAVLSNRNQVALFERLVVFLTANKKLPGLESLFLSGLCSVAAYGTREQFSQAADLMKSLVAAVGGGSTDAIIAVFESATDRLSFLQGGALDATNGIPGLTNSGSDFLAGMAQIGGVSAAIGQDGIGQWGVGGDFNYGGDMGDDDTVAGPPPPPAPGGDDDDKPAPTTADTTTVNANQAAVLDEGEGFFAGLTAMGSAAATLQAGGSITAAVGGGLAAAGGVILITSIAEAIYDGTQVAQGKPARFGTPYHGGSPDPKNSTEDADDGGDGRGVEGAFTAKANGWATGPGVASLIVQVNGQPSSIVIHGIPQFNDAGDALDSLGVFASAPGLFRTNPLAVAVAAGKTAQNTTGLDPRVVNPNFNISVTTPHP